MKIKDILIPFMFALGTTWLVQYFVFKPQNKEESLPGAEFTAPATKQVAQPLNLEIDFYDAAQAKAKEEITVETLNNIWKFSNEGAVVSYLGQKRMLAGKPGILDTINPLPQKERGAFLVALDGVGSTPYFYDLIENKKDKGITTLVYKAETNKAVITKKFTINDAEYGVKLNVTLEPKSGAVLQPRIFVPAPLLTESNIVDQVQGVVFTERAQLSKKGVKEVINKGWEFPPIFGAEDKYFVQIMTQDPQRFTNRAYFKVEDGDLLTSIFEGPTVKEKSSWDLTFYCGPKEIEILNAVDPRLDGLLDYGWFAPISKPIFYLLKLLYKYLGNYGLAIIILTLLLRLLMLPFTLRGERNMRQAAELQKKLQYIEHKYKNDPETLAREKAEVIKSQGMTSMLGCLPLFLQIPVFIGLNRVLSSSLELYKAPFFGWITDLSSKDPYYVLPILMGLGMAVQSAQQASGPAKQRLFSILMAVVVTGLISSLPAGLTLFFAVSTWLGILQTNLQKTFRL